MTFTPNMSSEQIAEHDAQRKYGNTNLYVNPTIVKDKKPWLNADGTHKSNEAGCDMSETAKAIEILKGMKIPDGKAFGKPEAAEETEKGQADAAGARASRERSARQQQRSSGKRERQVHEHYMARDMAARSGKSASPVDGNLESLRKYGKGCKSVDKDDELKDLADQLFDNDKEEKTEKALTSNSMHVLRPLGAYDPFNVQRSAVTIPVHRGAITETAAHYHQHTDTTYKSCVVHGITYRATTGCHPCMVQKSQSCPTCGQDMVKTAGGMLSCAKGHR